MKSGSVNPSIFRAYDIRGVYGKDLNEGVMESIGRAFAGLFVKDTVVVGMDGRTSGPSLKKSFIEGVTKAGKDVMDVGLVPRGACLFLGWKLKKPSAYVTASHLKKEWNGVKFSYENAVELFEEDNMKVRDAVLKGAPGKPGKAGKVAERDVIKQYMDFLLSRIPKASRRLKVVIDCGNGVGALVAPELFKAMGFSVEALFGDVDGSFPNRSSEITDETLGVLKERSKKADLGVAFDGDGDRMILVDEKGRLLGPEVTSKLILSELTKKEKGPIVANIECLKVMDEVAESLGRELYRVRVGNSFMVHEVEKRGACFGVERSGHFCIPSIIPMDDGIAASMYAASALSRTGKKLSEIVDSLPRYPFRRIKAECPDEKKFGVIDSLRKRLESEYDKVSAIDGVRVDFDYGWVLIRASNTGPLIRISAEATDEKKLDELSGKFKAILEEEIRKRCS